MEFLERASEPFQAGCDLAVAAQRAAQSLGSRLVFICPVGHELDARNIPTEMAPGVPYTVHGRVLAALDRQAGASSPPVPED